MTWTKPTQLPNLKHCKLIGLDTETCDPELNEKGPGVRRDGYMIGISVAVPDGHKWYLPFGHKQGDQFEKEHIMAWTKDNLCEPGQAKVGANIIYDLDYLYHAGVKVTGPFYDVQIAEKLINENRNKYDLDSLAVRYLNEHKTEARLKAVCKANGWRGKPQNHLWKMDAGDVGLYAEDDARQALQIFEKQDFELRHQQLETVFDIETRLMPMLLHMRQIGVPIDIKKMVELRGPLQATFDEKMKHLSALLNQNEPVGIYKAAELGELFDRFGYPYPLSAKTKKPSFQKKWLEKHEWEVANVINECRTTDKFKNTFIDGILNKLTNGRIHCQFNQIEARTGRFSSSDPNLQNIPSSGDLAKIIRSAFIPDEGYIWCKADYSQIEYRLLAHFSAAFGGQDIINAYIENPDMDVHEWCGNEVGVERKRAKNVNFGVVYGMGNANLAAFLGISIEKAKEFKEMYFRRFPFIQATTKAAMRTAERRGYVRTILGRRRRFHLWEPKDFDLSRSGKIKPHVNPQVVLAEMEALGTSYRAGVKRAGSYKAFNAADQGSAADIMKIAMVNVWESGLCDIIKPYLTVHDELDFGVPATPEGYEAAKEVQEIMVNAYKLKVPMLVDLEQGPNWGEVE